MRRTVKFASALLIPLLWLAEGPAAHALQVVEGSDGVTIDAVISLKEPTRIRIDGASITNVFGNIYSSNCGAAVTAPPGQPGATGVSPLAPAVNPAGEIVLECDTDKGEIYVRPVGGAGKPVNLFVSSQHATYTLLLRRSDTPADTIVIRDKTPRVAKADQAGGPTARQPQHVRALKAMLVAMASDRVPADVRVEEVNRPLQLWTEARFSLTRLYEGRGLIGERYSITNASNQTMVLAEQEFDRETGNVLAVSIENHNLRPGESTTVYVIRQGA
ncbi:conjugal transfer pilus assembly protein TraK [Roseateles aquatilis]|jgi:conjugal transfer pilus assembly protein TraK|uniref:Conjugal transfer pilus assembly protein TraK n=1 Tax=Roseateles aquatilis TaxID=431061 RepID=A0A246JEF3_9BURK|nr:type-F conjugative transfer system secretin TraK [Roseateles aquatilis]MBY0364926.1 type-F conjugative transfer system secretin TraK [Burkholderiaceae bacterium]OWQ90979.1 conjugal transfer pilus assembly protein TraK [Roseateles aquatilis]